MIDTTAQSLRRSVRAISRTEWFRVADELGFHVGEVERLFRRWWGTVDLSFLIVTSASQRNLTSPFIAMKRAAVAAGVPWDEKQRLEEVMRAAKGVVSDAARATGVDRTNLRRRLQRHGIDPAVFRTVDPEITHECATPHRDGRRTSG